MIPKFRLFGKKCVVFDEVKVTLSSHQTRGGSVGGGGGLRKWDGGDKDDDSGNSGITLFEQFEESVNVTQKALYLP